ncbi:MAG: mannose-1-phosphate guanylyltransferase [Flaviflexus sp.]|nr:mannose-1-phosphate guanylyltransferase [Flaviflexus sp.]
MAKFVAIIPAGGAGTRLWPLSRRSAPKFLHDLTGSGQTLLQATVDRLSPHADEILIVTGAAHADQVAEQVDIDEANIIAEPSPKNSMPAIGLAAAIAKERYGDAIIGSFAADHVIDDEAAFAHALEEARRLARVRTLVTIGITPTGADTGYGYIEPGEKITRDGLSVVEFTEKPERKLAERYVADGYLWNAGMFISTAEGLTRALEQHAPELAAGLEEIASIWDIQWRRDEAMGRLWPDFPSCVIDRVLAEPLAAAGEVAVVPADMGWSDIGGYPALAERLGGAELATTDPDKVMASASPGAVVFPGDRPVVVHGIEDAVVVDGGDVILVTTRTGSSQLPEVLGGVAEHGREDLL